MPLQKPEENKIILSGKWERRVTRESFMVESHRRREGNISNDGATQAKAKRPPETQHPVRTGTSETPGWEGRGPGSAGQTEL